MPVFQMRKVEEERSPGALMSKGLAPWCFCTVSFVGFYLRSEGTLTMC